jgi:hypothetical protein
VERSAFQVAVAAWQIAPGEFWRMSLEEFYWLYDVKRDDREHLATFYDPDLRAAIGL